MQIATLHRQTGSSLSVKEVDINSQTKSCGSGLPVQEVALSQCTKIGQCNRETPGSNRAREVSMMTVAMDSREAKSHINSRAELFLLMMGTGQLLKEYVETVKIIHHMIGTVKSTNDSGKVGAISNIIEIKQEE